VQSLSDFDYFLPESLIAQMPSGERGHSRLLVVNNTQPPSFQNAVFPDIIEKLTDRDLLVFNNTKVMHARLFAQKTSGGRVEIMVERVLSDRLIAAMLRASHAPKPGSVLTLTAGITATVLAREGMMYTLQLNSEHEALGTALDIIEHCGQLPLPPYITHTPTAQDEARYQTVYAKELGAVAAPTAGLHFTQALLTRLKENNIATAEITLHVGAGTFQPVKVENLSEHRMHHERYAISAETVAALEATRARGGRIVAVGTTSLRALESWAWQPGQAQGDTGIFITPGYQFKVVDALITNFHLPKSTLLMLVSALAGMDTIRAAYAHAIEHRYRFFSYGDAMWLERGEAESVG
jgi:S-adenosylmethionine:tRNA ribosyltransferase-isomerase